MKISECEDLSGGFKNRARENTGVNSKNMNLSEYNGHYHAILM